MQCEFLRLISINQFIAVQTLESVKTAVQFDLAGFDDVKLNV